MKARVLMGTFADSGFYSEQRIARARACVCVCVHIYIRAVSGSRERLLFGPLASHWCNRRALTYDGMLHSVFRVPPRWHYIREPRMLINLPFERKYAEMRSKRIRSAPLKRKKKEGGGEGGKRHSRIALVICASPGTVPR